MNRWAANNPELYEQLGHDGYLDYFREAADMERKRQKEEGIETSNHHACATCGAPVRVINQRCERCKASIEEDRLNRGE